MSVLTIADHYDAELRRHNERLRASTDIGPTDCVLLDAATADRALDRLRRMLEHRLTDDGVFFDSRAWIVTARRAGAATHHRASG